MHHNDILATISIAHHFKSAFNREQLYRYLRVTMDKKSFNVTLDGLVNDKIVSEKDNLLFLEDIEDICHQKKSWSKALFKENRKYLIFLSKLPWVKYIGLTGANSFESCNKEDDIDLFIITAPNRLWVCYLVMVLFTKLIGKRETLCINYLVDEKNLEIPEKNYFGAVQIIQMIPVFNINLHKKMIENNLWIFEVLPNATNGLVPKKSYLLQNNMFSMNGRDRSIKILDHINRKIYSKYSDRLKKKYPESFGRGIVVREGLAKLNRIDNQDIYENLFRQMEEHRIHENTD